MTSAGRLSSCSGPARRAAPDEVDFVDDDHGFVVTTDELLRTSDGGISWVAVGEPPAGALTAVRFFDADSGVGAVCEAGGFAVERTSDAGRTWSPVTLPPGTVRTGDCVVPAREGSGGVCFATASTGWAVARNGGHTALWRTTDSGASWQHAATGAGAPGAAGPRRLLGHDRLGRGPRPRRDRLRTVRALRPPSSNDGRRRRGRGSGVGRGRRPRIGRRSRPGSRRRGAGSARRRRPRRADARPARRRRHRRRLLGDALLLVRDPRPPRLRWRSRRRDDRAQADARRRIELAVGAPDAGPLGRGGRVGTGSRRRRGRIARAGGLASPRRLRPVGGRRRVRPAADLGGRPPARVSVPRSRRSGRRGTSSRSTSSRRRQASSSARRPGSRRRSSFSAPPTAAPAGRHCRCQPAEREPGGRAARLIALRRLGGHYAGWAGAAPAGPHRPGRSG